MENVADLINKYHEEWNSGLTDTSYISFPDWLSLPDILKKIKDSGDSAKIIKELYSQWEDSMAYPKTFVGFLDSKKLLEIENALKEG